MAACEAVLFDFDGVLVDSEPVHFLCWRELVAPFGILIDWQTYSDTYIGVPTRQMLSHFCDRAANGTTLEQLLELLPRKRQMFLELMCRELPFAADCRTMLASLSHLRLGVVTSSNRLEVEPVLAAAGLRESFDVLVCGGDVRSQKPSAEPYLKAAELLGVSAALVVEDSDAGVESARAAGFEVIRVGNPGEVWPALQARVSNFR
ncbi:MAG: HAD family phosphatase [Bryobacteraceae bacterium]|jgi:HAD superfamily hydrolase (TIGR01509 family)